MIKNLKNTFIYYYIYKFRKKLSILFGIILFDIILSFFIADLEFIIDNQLLLFSIKWGFYILSIVIIFFIFKNKAKKLNINIKEKKCPKREQNNLQNRSDFIIDKYKTRG